MLAGGNGITKMGNLKHATLNITYEWVLNAWNDISAEIIICSFKKCCISNCMMGSENHLIYEDNES